MLHAERVSSGLVLGLAVVAGAFAMPARSAPPLPPAITIVEPVPTVVEPQVQRVTDESCPLAVLDHLRPAEHATCVRGDFHGTAIFVHVSYFTTEAWEHIGVVDTDGHTRVPFIDRPSLYGDASIRLRVADLDNDGADEVIATYGHDRAVEVFSVMTGEVQTLARADAIHD
jgi:hypothetical protein